jgi:hypothetical protein
MTDEKKIVPAIQSRGAKVNADITALLKARNTLLWIVTREEGRVEAGIVEAAAAAKYPVSFWDCAAGHTDTTFSVLDAQKADPQSMLRYIGTSAPRGVFVMRDLHKWLDPQTTRQLRSLARSLEREVVAERMRAVVVLSPSAEVPPELAGHAVVLDYPLPDRIEITKLLEDFINSLDESRRATAAPNGTKELAVDAAVGLTAQEAVNCYARSMVSAKKIDPALVAADKKRVIERERVLTWHEPDPRGLDGIGGLDVLKGWLLARKMAFSQKARAFGLPSPKGCMIAGLPGVGKSLAAKCVATAFGMPLLRIDFGALQSKYVGESQANIRKALAVAETVSPCVVLADELDKALAGAGGSASDGGVAADALGTFLTWMQERQGSVFVIATANDVRGLPPELLRKGRFDEVFWVDLPTKKERREILVTTLKQYKREGSAIDLDLVVKSMDTFTGSEIAAIVPEALFKAFAEGERDLSTDDLLEAAANVVPLATTAKEKLSALRDWAKTRARAASTPEVPEQTTTVRALDIDNSN